MLEKVTAEDFEPYVQKRMSLKIGDYSQEVTLVSVRKNGRRHPDAQREAFTIEVQGDPNKQLLQNIYALECEGLEKMHVFFVPVAQGTYCATFN